jgi:hypothetical protein
MEGEVTGYLDTPARSLEEVRAEVQAEYDAVPEGGASGLYELMGKLRRRGQLRARLAQIDAEIKARVKP